MAEILSKEIEGKKAVTGRLGKQILDVITSGMYSDPRMAIREYIQNAADSIDLAESEGMYGVESAQIMITVNGRDRCITIEDNGLGVDESDVDIRLGSLGCSSKSGGGQRGFRGIGRLAGLAYCDILRFETRQSGKQPVHVVEWSGQALRDQTTDVSGHERLSDSVKRIAYVATRRALSSDPDRFFRVTLIRVHRFHADLLMNIKGLREYLSQTAPVPYLTGNFSHSDTVSRHLCAVHGFRNYRLVLNDTQIFRPYEDKFHVREGHSDNIRDIKLVELVGRSGQLLCRGWYATTGFLAALPQQVAMRGLRVRQGNIAVGDEYFFKDHFTEARFATWHIGELNVAPALKLNARRDGFEETAEYEEFLEWVSLLCRHLSLLARQSSGERSGKQNVIRLVKDIEKQLMVPFFVSDAHLESYFRRIDRQLDCLKRIVKSEDTCGLLNIATLEDRLTARKNKPLLLINAINGQLLNNKKKKDLLIELCGRILDITKNGEVEKLITSVVKPYLKAAIQREIESE